jgi:hypothetical protein
VADMLGDDPMTVLKRYRQPVRPVVDVTDQMEALWA